MTDKNISASVAHRCTDGGTLASSKPRVAESNLPVGLMPTRWLWWSSATLASATAARARIFGFGDFSICLRCLMGSSPACSRKCCESDAACAYTSASDFCKSSSSMSITSASDQKIDSCRSSHAPTLLLTASTAVTPCTAAACSSHSALASRSTGDRTFSHALHSGCVLSASSLSLSLRAKSFDRIAMEARYVDASSSPTRWMRVASTSGSTVSPASTSACTMRNKASSATRCTKSSSCRANGSRPRTMAACASVEPTAPRHAPRFASSAIERVAVISVFFSCACSPAPSPPSVFLASAATRTSASSRSGNAVRPCISLEPAATSADADAIACSTSVSSQTEMRSSASTANASSGICSLAADVPS
mmetsp:Transcript_60409/g.138566  ORF Transcript_60409/g.138566 Transcript_60409/m.138566 type:complete len:365 (-) Transcript_60409:476-1570(-)